MSCSSRASETRRNPQSWQHLPTRRSRKPRQQNKQALGVVPPYKTYVDGREGAPLASVKPDGIIRVEFQLVNEALAWIYQAVADPFAGADRALCQVA